MYGAGGHGKVVADLLVSRGEKEFAGFVDDCEELWGAKVMGFTVLGGGEWLQWEAGSARIAVALGVGDNASRHWIAESCAYWGAEILTVVHPRAAVSRAADVGAFAFSDRPLDPSAERAALEDRGCGPQP